MFLDEDTEATGSDAGEETPATDTEASSDESDAE